MQNFDEHPFFDHKTKIIFVKIRLSKKLLYFLFRYGKIITVKDPKQRGVIMVKMRKKLVSIALVLMIILTTAVATYAMEPVSETAGSANSVVSAEESDAAVSSQLGYVPDGIAHEEEVRLDQLASLAQTKEEAEVTEADYEDYVVPNAGQPVTVTFLNRNIVVNGEPIVNYQSDYPYFIYNDIIYVPITWENCRIFGYDRQLDSQWGSILTRTSPTQTNYDERWVKNTEDTMTATISDKMVTVRRENPQGGYDEIILTSEITQGYPILEYHTALYIPLTFNVVNTALGWNKEFDNYSGLYLNTMGTACGTMVDSQASAYNKALVNYIRGINPTLTEQEAVDMVFLVKQKAQIYGVDERLILAMIQKESTFYENVSGGSAIGLMQIMPATGRALGATPDQLRDPDINVELGTKYIAQHINTFGNISQALVAYNAGSGVARSGKTSSGYSNTVLKYYNNMVSVTSM